MPPQLVAIVVPFVSGTHSVDTLLPRNRVRMCRFVVPRQRLTAAGPSSNGIHHVPGMWMPFGTWWMPFASKIHFDNWQRQFAARAIGSAVRQMAKPNGGEHERCARTRTPAEAKRCGARCDVVYCCRCCCCRRCCMAAAFSVDHQRRRRLVGLARCVCWTRIRTHWRTHCFV